MSEAVLSAEQFEKLLERLSLRQEDHDTLIRIETIVQMSAANFETYKTDMAVKIAKAEQSTGTAHKRLDEEIKTRWVFAGGVGLLGFAGVCLEVWRIIHP